MHLQVKVKFKFNYNMLGGELKCQPTDGVSNIVNLKYIHFVEFQRFMARIRRWKVHMWVLAGENES